MQLKQYRQFSKFYTFTPSTARVQPAAEPAAGFCGYLAKLADGQVAALYKQRGQLVFQLGQQRWVHSIALQSTHKHIDGGKAMFTLYQNGQQLLEYIYPSWWLGHETHLLPALAELDDDEDDFLGYVHSVFEDEKKGVARAAAWHDAD